MSGDSEWPRQGSRATTAQSSAHPNSHSATERLGAPAETREQDVSKPAGTTKRARNEPKLPTGGGAPVQKDGAPDISALLERYGITTVPNVVYEWGGYRYSNPTDAIAAAKRGTSS